MMQSGNCELVAPELSRNPIFPSKFVWRKKMPKLRSVSLIALTAMSLMASGCQKKAEGQVVAIVNGEEITLPELNAEISELNVPETADKNLVRQRVLQRMVERRLLVQSAKEAGVDRDPQYLTQERRMQEQLMISMYGRKAMDTIKVPDTAEVDRYIAAHPTMFADRKRLRLNQLVFPAPSNPQSLEPLKDAHNLDEAAAKLTQLGIRFQRGQGALDSATVRPEVLKRLEALPPGEPFIVPNGGNIVVSTIVGIDPVALPAEQARPLAVEAMRREELNRIGQQRLNEAKAKAKIEYQTGYEPPAGGAGNSSEPPLGNSAAPPLGNHTAP